YFDIVVEYAKATTEDLCVRIEAHNRGPEPATLHVLPHLWFRNTWDWGPERGPSPVIRGGHERPDALTLVADDAARDVLKSIPIPYALGPRTLYAPLGGVPMFTDNETNRPRVFGAGNASVSRYVKDAFHRHVIAGEDCINPSQRGTKAAIHYE